jgi:hypothetical protein
VAKRKPTDREGTKGSSPASKPVELVVRRGALWRFNVLKRKTAELPVNVLWDRRQTDRRKESQDVGRDQRDTDRRKEPPFTWEMADFVVVGQMPEAEGAGRATSKKKTSRAPRARKGRTTRGLKG